jgi:predicted nucleic acid-binding protein
MVTRGLADSSVFIANESGGPLNSSFLPEEFSLSIISIGELRSGVLAAQTVELRDQRLATLTWAMSLNPQPVNDHVAASWAKLRVLLRDSGQKMPVNDSWIAATAMSLDLPLITQDRYYVAVAGLTVMRV